MNRKQRRANGAPSGGSKVSFSPEAALRLAMGHHGDGRLAEALDIYERILKAEPAHPDALHLAGLVLYQQGEMDAALARIDAALAAETGFAEAHANRGLVLNALGRPDDAVAAYDCAIALSPDLTIAHNNRGNALLVLGQIEPAIAAFRQALAQQPDYAEAWSNLGNAHLDAGALGDALNAYDEALTRQPGFVDARLNRMKTLLELGRESEVLAEAEAVLSQRPDIALAHNNKGLALQALGRIAQAEAAYRQAVALAPTSDEMAFNLALVVLAQARFSEGWEGFERGIKAGLRKPARPFTQPRWQGEQLAQRTILVWGEQGIGDEILHAGAIPALLEGGAQVVMECRKRLMPLFARSFPGVELVPTAEPPAPRSLGDDIDFACPTAGLWAELGRVGGGGGGGGAYLTADPQRIRRLRDRYEEAAQGRKIVGLSWRSKSIHAGKSAPLSAWAPLLGLENVMFVDLQYGDTAADRADIRDNLGVSVLHDPEIDALIDADGFAAQVAAMDAVVSISNSTVHMAGALGVPCWVLLPRGRGLLWYWGIEGETTPFYPSLTLLRQPCPGAWGRLLIGAAERVSAWEAATRGS